MIPCRHLVIPPAVGGRLGIHIEGDTPPVVTVVEKTLVGQQLGFRVGDVLLQMNDVDAAYLTASQAKAYIEQMVHRSQPIHIKCTQLSIRKLSGLRTTIRRSIAQSRAMHAQVRSESATPSLLGRSQFGSQASFSSVLPPQTQAHTSHASQRDMFQVTPQRK
eukprot:m.177056 g.177056  ORF g.177056 m.177056 type:complete len:162 (+) comp14632_c0_seq25:64-549(+)